MSTVSSSRTRRHPDIHHRIIGVFLRHYEQSGENHVSHSSHHRCCTRVSNPFVSVFCYFKLMDEPSARTAITTLRCGVSSSLSLAPSSRPSKPSSPASFNLAPPCHPCPPGLCLLSHRSSLPACTCTRLTSSPAWLPSPSFSASSMHTSPANSTAFDTFARTR